MLPSVVPQAVAAAATVAATVAMVAVVAAAAIAATEAAPVAIAAVAAPMLPQRSQRALRERDSTYSTKLHSDDPDVYHLITNRPHTQLRFASQANDHAHWLRDNDLESISVIANSDNRFGYETYFRSSNANCDHELIDLIMFNFVVIIVVSDCRFRIVILIGI